MLSKSSFLHYLQCPTWFWFQHHKPEVLAIVALKDFEQMLADQGMLVEQEVYKRFQDIVLVTAKGIHAVTETKSLLEKGHRWIGQAGFSTDDLFTQTDILHFKENGRVDIYEIKSSSSMQSMNTEDASVPPKHKHITDLAFQLHVVTQAGWIVDTTYLIEMNKEYRLQGSLDHQNLFAIHNVTEKVRKFADELQQKINEALIVSQSTEQPTTCNCKYLPRKKQCPAFSYLHPELMDYSVYDLNRIGASPKRLKQFVDEGIYFVRDIPGGYDMLDSCRDQVHTWNTGEVIFLRDQIERSLNELTYPLYFLDYETVSTAIPQYEAIRPYMHVPFQYSLHVIPEPGAEVQHVEYLHAGKENPMHALSRQLRRHIGDTGTIIVWNKSFENKCNENMASIVGDQEVFLHNMNDRLYDLMDIFSKRYYVHKDFKGSCSIKKVLPVVAPHLTYEGLNIADGGTATTQWKRMVFEMEDETEKAVLSGHLLEYCKLDTLAMVEIYNCIRLKLVQEASRSTAD